MNPKRFIQNPLADPLLFPPPIPCNPIFHARGIFVYGTRFEYPPTPDLLLFPIPDLRFPDNPPPFSDFYFYRQFISQQFIFLIQFSTRVENSFLTLDLIIPPTSDHRPLTPCLAGPLTPCSLKLPFTFRLPSVYLPFPFTQLLMIAHMEPFRDRPNGAT